MLAVQAIPLSKLVASNANVRRTGRTTDLKQLAASIKAHGLLQNLTVRKGSGEHKGLFEVVAGSRRLAAMQKLVASKDLEKSAPIACHVLDEQSDTEISLAENLHCPMHPADQFEAFAKLHRDENMPAEDIAARFGVTAAVVRQRLKLGNVSPKLIKRYREGDMTLEQLTAFTVTDDHAAQERVWRDLPEYQRHREAILSALTEAHVSADDRRALFVGEAYIKAGGGVLRDLFDSEGGGYLTDPELLDRLAREKLQRAASKVMAEGWKWVSVDPVFDYGSASGMRRVYARLSDEDEAALTALRVKENDLLEAEEEGEDVTAALKALEAEIIAVEGRDTFLPDDVASAGCFVALDSRGKPRIERGFVRREDVPIVEVELADGAPGEKAAPSTPALSDKLVIELTAARTSALRYELGNNPEAALTALLHAMVSPLFSVFGNKSCLQITFRQAALGMHAPQLAEGSTETAVAERHAAWEKRLSLGSGDLWQAIESLSADDRWSLLAHCTALTIDAVHGAKALRHPAADGLARAIDLDMTKHWQPTAANYLGRVSKERIKEALTEGVSNEAAENLATLKKGAMADAAAQRLAGRGWLPQVLRTA